MLRYEDFPELCFESLDMDLDRVRAFVREGQYPLSFSSDLRSVRNYRSLSLSELIPQIGLESALRALIILHGDDVRLKALAVEMIAPHAERVGTTDVLNVLSAAVEYASGHIKGRDLDYAVDNVIGQRGLYPMGTSAWAVVHACAWLSTSYNPGASVWIMPVGLRSYCYANPAEGLRQQTAIMQNWADAVDLAQNREMSQASM